MREVRRSRAGDTVIVVCAADPLNLAGIVTSGERIRVAGRNRLAYRNGAPVAVREGDEVRSLIPGERAVDDDVVRALSTRSRQYGRHTFV
jgi:ATP-dependent Lhr-like helicase